VTAVGLEDVYFVSMFLPKGQARRPSFHRPSR
jgi:hypothetical protein